MSSKMKKILCGIVCALVGCYFLYNYAAPRLTMHLGVMALNEIEDVNDLEMIEELSDQEKELIVLIMQEVTLEVVGFEKSGDQVMSTISIDGPDFMKLISDNWMSIMGSLLSDLGNVLAMANGGQMRELVVEQALLLIQDVGLGDERATIEVEIPLERDGLLWIPVMDEDTMMEMIDLPAGLDMSPFIGN